MIEKRYMTQNLELICFDEKSNFYLKTSISKYLTKKEFQFKFIERKGISVSDNFDYVNPIVKFKHHVVSFSNNQDINVGLSRLHHLLHEAKHGTKKGCLNCANCSCQNNKQDSI